MHAHIAYGAIELVEHEKRLSLADMTYYSASTGPITYSPIQRTLRIHGLEPNVRRIYDRFKCPRDLATTFALQKTQHVNKFDIDKTVRKMSSSTDCSCKEPQDEDQNLRIFAVNTRDDGDLVAAWESHVVPFLPEMLDHTVGNSYSVCLVREGPSKQQSQPCARIQSPKKPSLQNRQFVINDIIRRLAQCPVTPPYIRFLKGETTDLVDGGRGNVKENSYENNSEDSEDVETFPYHKAYWEKPGMGASVGLYGDLEVSGTLGGYITVDDKQYLLVTNHMVDEAEKRGFRSSSDSLRLTSPSLADVDEINKSLKHCLLSSDARIRDILSTEQDYISPREAESLLNTNALPNLRHETAVLLVYLADVAKDHEEYVIGKLAAHTRQRRSQYSGSPHAPSGPFRDSNWIKMDWSIFETSPSERRVGQNRHRYRQLSEGGKLDYSTHSPSDVLGVGTECQRVCDLQPNIPIRYVGRNSGLRQGEINASRMLVRTGADHQPTNEWCIVSDEPQLTVEKCKGDSGAFVLNDATDEAMATIFAISNSCLLVTPLADTLADIKSQRNATQVILSPVSRGPAPQAPLAVPLCDVTDRSKPAKGYKIASLLNPSTEISAVKLMLKRGPCHEIPISKTPPSPPSLEDGNSSSRSLEQELHTPTEEVDRKFHFPPQMPQKITLSFPPIRTLEDDRAMGTLRAIPSS